jgi:hypothetical protein
MLTAGRNPGYALRDLAACADRETKLRRKVYANRVETGRMSRQQADTEIRKMEAIAELLAEAAKSERLL